jgi:hypothetical protein
MLLANLFSVITLPSNSLDHAKGTTEKKHKKMANPTIKLGPFPSLFALNIY